MAPYMSIEQIRHVQSRRFSVSFFLLDTGVQSPFSQLVGNPLMQREVLGMGERKVEPHTFGGYGTPGVVWPKVVAERRGNRVECD